MPLLRSVPWTFSIATMFLGAGALSGQDYPNKTIRIVAPSAGGDSDFMARFVARGISGPLGQQVIVDNRASGLIPGQVVSQASPDGYTMLVAGSSFWVGPLMQKTPYDPVRNFSPITLAVSSPNVLVVHPSVPVNSVKDLIALARAKPGGLNYSSTGTGGSSHLSAELFKAMSGVDIVRVPFSTVSARMAALLSNEVQIEFTGPAITSQIKAGKLKALAVTSARPSALFPGLPTISASGVPGYEAVGRNGMLAPAGTPVAIINRLNREIVQFLNLPDVKQRFFELGSEVVGSSPGEFAAVINSDIAKWSKVIKDAGIKAE